MGLRGSCHCGGVTLAVPHAPAWVGSCNCSLCRKLGWLVAYYPDDAVKVTGETIAYVWGDRLIGIHHCPICGCGTHWKTLGEDFGRMGLNARLLDGFDPAKVEVRLLDNAGD
ncbi:MAG: glutathione-dependent formaldehyde-activating [Alphaproteobacteria bacterium]|nr:glutathione-dependent formaldehyde-activating [Alphaproteobacteria bacterium]